MIGDEPMTIFGRLAKSSGDVWDKTLDIRRAEPAFIEALQTVRGNPALRSSFGDYLIKILEDPGLGPQEFVSFLNHALRWEEVKQRIQSSLTETEKTRDERRRHVLQGQLEAFSDDWEDADMYTYFQRTP